VLLEMSGGSETPDGERLQRAIDLEERVTAEWWANYLTWRELRAERAKAK
jgi:hypothetical protein